MEGKGGPKESREKGGERVGEKLTANQKRIIEHIMLDSSISAKELSAKVSILQRKIEQNIAKLKQKGISRRVGSDRGGYWKKTS